jgi:hypothetical protein
MFSRTTIAWAALITVALGLRVGLVLALAAEHRAPLTYEHGEIAENLLAGRGFSVRFLGVEGPTSQQAPFYPALLAGMYWLLGSGSSASILAMQLLQCLAGTGVVLCVLWLARSLMPDRPLVAWLTGWGAALYPPHIYMVTHIQVVTWSALLLTLLAAVVLAPGRTSSWRKPATAGVIGGFLLLVDPILVLALPMLAIALAARGGQSAIRNPQSAILMALTTCLVIAPWLWRNASVHGELVFIKSTFGYAFWQGNNPLSWGTDKVPKPSAETLRRDHDGSLAGINRALWEARHETVYIDDLLLKPHGYREFRGLSEPQRSRLLGKRGWESVRSHPARYLQLCLQRLRYFLLFDETNPKAANSVYRASTLVWLSLSAAGVFLLVCQRRGLHAHWPLLAIFASVTLFHVLTIVSARFRIPLEPLSFVWCALAAERICLAVRQSLVSITPSSWPTLRTSSSATNA